jgi:hypothetical protein
MGAVYRLEKALLLRAVHPNRALELAMAACNRFRELGARPQENAASELIGELRGEALVGARLSA